MRPSFRWWCAGLAFAVVSAWVPARYNDRFGADFYAGDPALQDALAAGVASRQRAGVDASAFATGAARFDGEWAFGSALMAVIGFAQLIEQRPETRAQYLPELERALDALLLPERRAYDTAAWGEDAIAGLGGPNAHLAYLGYVAVPLGLHRSLAPDSRFAPVHDAIAAHLAAHLHAAPAGLVETYPGERYPVDNAVSLTGLALHARATGGSLDWLPAWEVGFRDHIAADTGLLVQAVDRHGSPLDAPRASGTLFAAWFLSRVSPELSRDLWLACSTHQRRQWAGFGTVREYPPGVFGVGDIDSGPVVLGQGVSATGFGIGVARALGDEAAFRALLTTAVMVGAPHDGGDGWRWLTGGPLGDAILFAMLTTPPVSS